MPKLVVKTGRDAGKSYPLSKSAILGRGDTVQIKVLDAKASREHCRVFVQNGEWVVVDLNSRNGITVNEMKKTRHALQQGDEIAIGEAILVFHADADATPSGAARQKSERQAPPEPSDKVAKAKAAKEKAFAAARAGGAKGPGRAAPGATGTNADGSVQVSDRVLQFNKVAKGGFLSFDIAQYSLLTQVLIGMGALALLGVVGWLLLKAFANS